MIGTAHKKYKGDILHRLSLNLGYPIDIYKDIHHHPELLTQKNHILQRSLLVSFSAKVTMSGKILHMVLLEFLTMVMHHRCCYGPRKTLVYRTQIKQK